MELYNKSSARIASFLLVCFLNQLLFPVAALALTGGPSQPEVESFKPIDSNNMVDLFTGDFSYNIPLFDIGGYPINLSYNSGITMDQEATWVGLGWTLNPGSINREKRGFPDEFRGDIVKREYNVKPDKTIGVTLGTNFEFFGGGSIGGSVGIYNNTYKGMGVEGSINPGITLARWGQTGSQSSLGIGANLSFDSQQGGNLGVSVNYGLEEVQQMETTKNLNLKFGGYNSRAGLRALAVSGSYSIQKTLRARISGVNIKATTTNYDINANGAIGFGSYSFTPTSKLSFRNSSGTFTGSVGGAVTGGNLAGSVTGYSTIQELSQKTYGNPAYGYMNSDLADEDENNLMDFNRERGGVFHENMPVMPMSQGTFDLFDISGQGSGGQFRVVRNDVGCFRDVASQNSSDNVNGGAQIGLGNAFKLGADIETGNFNSKSSAWNNENDMKSKSDFTSPEYNTDYEPWFFKLSGDLSLRNEAFYNNLGKDHTIRTILGKDISGISASLKDNAFNSFVAQESMAKIENLPVNSLLKRQTRVPRTKVITYLNASEASRQGLEKDILNYPMNQLVYASCSSNTQGASPIKIPRGSRPFHHISEIDVLEPGGMRYVYGIPAYNEFEESVSFAVTSDITNPMNISYENGDNSKQNTKGVDNFYEKETTPAYPHSFLITGVLSPDYVDLTNNGISEDDLGTAVKFNYTKLANNYKWRSPYLVNSARYDRGLISLDGATESDDRGNYIYGERETWYVHSIESNTQIALFVLEDRDDALPVLGENGGMDNSSTKRLKRLKEIKIYNKADLLENTGSLANIIPIKTITFTYDYTSCTGIENSATSSGKLTLKGIYTTYGKNKAKFNYYRFDYTTATASAYGQEKYDRWGYFKKNNPLLPNKVYPFSSQVEAETNQAANYWNLKTISLPSGGTINVEYESDDYAFVQNKRAGQMIYGLSVETTQPLFIGFAKDLNTTPTSSLYTNSSTPNNFLFIDAPALSPGYVMTLSEFKERYMEDVEQLYFNVLCTLRPANIAFNIADVQEYVNGYARIKNVLSTSTSNRFAIELEPPLIGSVNTNPICKAALQFLKLNLPRAAYSATTTEPSSSVQDEPIEFLIGAGVEIVRTLEGFDNYAKADMYAKSIDLSKSYIRLANPAFKKFGGGSRVKSVTMSDVWDAMTPGSGTQTPPAGRSSKTYKTLYTYTTEKTINGQKKLISSGVASYEPGLGNEENLMKNPLSYTEDIALAADNFYYVETPIGESLFPSPIVGYSEVKVSKEETNYSKVGYTVNKFYTAKDFPVITDYTDLLKAEKKGNPILNFFKIGGSHSMTVSQGIKVEVNDMHGKPREENVFDATGVMISSKTYSYLEDDEKAAIRHLKNTVNVIDRDLSVSTGCLGMDMDVWQDNQEDKSEYTSFSLKLGTDAFTIPPIPFIIPNVFPMVTSDKKSFRFMTTTKFIKRTGLLDKITVMSNGSTITTQNLAYDKYTGDVLVTKTQNEFNDYTYQTTFPAHWAYDNMGLAYKNIDLTFSQVKIDNGDIVLNSNNTIINNFITEGDELLAYKKSGGAFTLVNRLYVVKANLEYKVVDETGSLATLLGNNYLRIKRSGSRNQPNAPIATFTTMKSPIINNNTLLEINTAKDIVNSSAALYSQDWQTKNNLHISRLIEQEIDISFSSILTKLTNSDLYWNTMPGTTTLENMGVSLMPSIQDGAYYYVNQGAPPDERCWYFEAIIEDNGTLYRLVIEDITGKYFYLKDLTYNTSTFQLKFGNNILSRKIFKTIVSPSPTTCYSPSSAVNPAVNPYFLNMKGAWRPYKTYAYHSNRTPGNTATNANIRTSGIYSDFTPFWSNSGQAWNNISGTPGNWIGGEEMLSYDQRGNSLQSKDVLNNHSAVQFGYNNNAVIAVADSTELNDMGYDGFEDYLFLNNCTFNQNCDYDPSSDLSSTSNSAHFNFLNSNQHYDLVKKAKSHTGLFSLELPAGQSVSLLRSVKNGTNDMNNRLSINTNGTYALGTNGNIPIFNPSAGKYIISAWVYVTSSNAIPKISVSGNPDIMLSSNEPNIEGWKKITGIVEVLGTENSPLMITLSAAGGTVYFDDIRIHPKDGNLNSYVYDRYTLRLMAELDENNYATFYEYNDAGQLIRVKKETEKGIMTLQENRQYLSTMNQ